MSDLLFMSRSPLRSLLHTPGLVACYLPWRDVYGRNVARATGPSSYSYINKTGDWESLTIREIQDRNDTHWFYSKEYPSDAGYFAVRFQAKPVGREYFSVSSYSAGFGDHPTSILFHLSGDGTATAPSDTDSYLNNSWSISSVGDGWYEVSFVINSDDAYANGYVRFNLSSDGETWSYLGDSDKGIDIRNFQVNVGSTLYPYTAPEGYPQTLLDYSGRGNHAQLGSTAGSDTNDPSWGSNALTFGGDDYCVLPSTLFDSFPDGTEATLIAAFKTSDDIITQQEIFDLGDFSSISYDGYRILIANSKICAQYGGDTERKTCISSNLLSTQTAYCVSATYTPTRIRILLDGTLSSQEIVDDGLNKPTFGAIGTESVIASFLKDGGEIYGALAINRAVSVFEQHLLLNTLKTLLAGQGVTLA